MTELSDVINWAIAGVGFIVIVGSVVIIGGALLKGITPKTIVEIVASAMWKHAVRAIPFVGPYLVGD